MLPDNLTPAQPARMDVFALPRISNDRRSHKAIAKASAVTAAVTLCAVLSAFAAQHIEGWSLVGAILVVIIATVAAVAVSGRQEFLWNAPISETEKYALTEKLTEQRPEHNNREAIEIKETEETKTENIKELRSNEIQDIAHAAEMSTSSAIELISISEGLKLYSNDTTYRFELVQDDERYQEKQELNRLFETADAQANTKKALIQNIAHEIKTPLTSLKLIAEGLEDGVFAPDDDYTQRTINDNVARIDATVKMMTQYARGGNDATMGEISGNVENCLHMSCEKARAIASNRPEVSITYENLISTTNGVFAAHNAQLLVKLSSQSLCSIFDALIENSLDHAKDLRSISLRSACEHHPSNPKSQMIRITVQDDGKGVTEDMAAKMMEPFWKGDDSHKLDPNKVTSPGLGLSIVKSMVESNGGKISVECGKTTGTKVSMWLPIVEDAVSPAQETINEEIFIG